MERKYICFYDNGVSYNCEFTFYSKHRANSKANYLDAEKYANKVGIKDINKIHFTQLSY